MLERIGAIIGTVEEIDDGESGSLLGQYTRLKVRIDITKPLQKFVRIGVENGEDVIILLTYERLPDFCNQCGIIGHSFRNCGKETETKGSMEFGQWMRAQAHGSKGKFKSPKKTTPKPVSSALVVCDAKLKGDDGARESPPHQNHVAVHEHEEDLELSNIAENMQMEATSGEHKSQVGNDAVTLDGGKLRMLLMQCTVRAKDWVRSRWWKNRIISLLRRWLPSNPADLNELNVRGLGNQRAFRELKRLIADKQPSLLFLCETRKRDINNQQWSSLLGFKGCFSVSSMGHSGGLCLCWKDPLEVSIKSYSLGHIDCIVRHDDKIWRFTGFYGNPETRHRHLSWSLLKRLANMHEFNGFPLLIGGDFNEICYESEKLGGNRRPTSQMEEFRNVLDICNLQSLHCSGDLFTWANRQQNEALIFERLDRFNWSRQRKYRFEAFWARDVECEAVIADAWDNTLLEDHGLLGKIRYCSLMLHQWSRQGFHAIPKKLKSKREQLSRLRMSDVWNVEKEQVHELETEVEQLCSQEELYWRQRSRVDWLSMGDKNTKFFHRRPSLRKMQNHINGLISHQGDFIQDLGGMSNIITDYFDALFTSTAPSSDVMSPVLNCIDPSITNDMNFVLCAPFTALDIKIALFDMSPDKSPGPDGMSTLFYQKYWHIIGVDVTKAALAILNDGAPMDDWNKTVITLIPKVPNPLMVKEFRPISLCNVCYKIIARALTNRLRPMMKYVIDDCQSDFVPGRLISDNIILGFEAVHWMRSRKKGKYGYAALKLDMSKAYDRVEWNFLEAFMLKLGFNESWVGKVMSCISSVSYSFKVNQHELGNLIPGRGIRQGDPLSPYLFALCAQGLSAMLSSFESQGCFKGVRIASSCPSLSHLFFAEDSLIFFKAEMEDCQSIAECLKNYERASGKVINFEKSALSFTPNTVPAMVNRIKSELTIPVVQGHEIYLGLPTFSLRSKKVQFSYLVERILGRIRGWGSKFFSVGGKETLIKSVLQAIPTYAMSCFRIPKGICEEIEKACANFWWGLENGKKQMHWKTWDFLCKPKCEGGLAFQKMEIFNKALLAKQIWGIIQNPSSLVARVLKARYFRHVDIMNAGVGNNPSFIWRSLIWSRGLLEEGIYWRIGDGSSVNIFQDKWIPSRGATIDPWMVNLLEDSKVSDLIANHQWNENLIRSISVPYIVSDILSIPLSNTMSALKELSIIVPREDSASPAHWLVPPIGQLRLDTDESFDASRNCCGIGCVVRNHLGQPLVAFGKTVPIPESVVLGELMAIREGLKLIRDKDFHQVIIFSDSLLAVQAVTAPQSDLCYTGSCAQDIKTLISQLEIVSLFHVRRSANVVAHSLAKFSISSPAPFCWVSGSSRDGWLIL
ncbi:uncharacterized protein [Henckelia pumila]|uniref:uncharacterized protein n=1 Tax=Henckelia pumila TaxID=405737 RepID=UPI003C6DF32D